jgi:iron complex transport system ATP-binding protein
MDYSSTEKMEIIVEISSLEITAGKGGKILIENFSEKINSGELIALTGLNGSGKSTLLFSLCGLNHPNKGKVEIKGKNLHTSTVQEKSRLCSIVFTSQENIPWMDVYSFVASGRAPYTNLTGNLSAEDKSIIEKIISETGLKDFRERFIHTLSDGEKQRCLIARALVQDTPFILLDEPTAFLDIRNKKQMMELLNELCIKHQKAILFSTHDIQLAKKYSNSIWWISDKKISAVSPENFNEEVFH